MGNFYDAQSLVDTRSALVKIKLNLYLVLVINLFIID